MRPLTELSSPTDQLTGRVAKRLCSFQVDKRTRTATISAAPTCSKGLTLSVDVAAKKAGERTNRFTKTWKVKAQPPVVCKVRATG